jgi:hypothetical protein
MSITGSAKPVSRLLLQLSPSPISIVRLSNPREKCTDDSWFTILGPLVVDDDITSHCLVGSEFFKAYAGKNLKAHPTFAYFWDHGCPSGFRSVSVQGSDPDFHVAQRISPDLRFHILEHGWVRDLRDHITGDHRCGLIWLRAARHLDRRV